MVYPMRLQPLSLSRAPRNSIPLRPAPDPARTWFPAGLALIPTLGWAAAGWPGLAVTLTVVLAGIALLAAATGR